MGFFSDRREIRKEKRRLEKADLAYRAAQKEANTVALNAQREAVSRFINSGYSHGGASRSATWARGYQSESLSPKSDIEENRKLLRERTRDLAMNAPIATAAINSTRTSCVGSGLVPKPKIDYEFLGISEEEAVVLKQKIKKEFSVWATSSLCDVCDLNNFYELQQIVFSDWLKNGEEFVLIRYEERETDYMPYRLRLKLIPADRVSTPGSLDGDYDGFDKRLANGNTVMNGVEINRDGKVEAYYISSVFPGEYSAKAIKWQRVRKRGEKTGNPNILHIFNADTAEQYRGVPFLAPVIQAVKQLTRYTEAEIMAAVINSMFVLFICTEASGDVGKFTGAEDNTGNPVSSWKGGEDKIAMGSGTINVLNPGEEVKAVESQHPSGNFDAFTKAMCNMIGAALEISPEVLLKKFGSNFSASKGALNETWQSFMMRRKWFVNDFCQQVYELWFAEAVSKGRIKAPGFFTDPLIKKAYTNASWTGPAQGCLDPLKEVNAAEKRIYNGLSTREDECAAMNGSDYDDNVRTLQNENRRLQDARGSIEALRHSEDDEEEDGDNED